VRSNRADGFTLVEMLVALALISLIATYTVSALSFAQRVRQAELRTELNAETDGARRHLKSVIANAQLFVAAVQQERRITTFEGRPDSLSLTSTLDDHLEVGGLYTLNYAREADGFVLNYRLFRFGGESEPLKPLLLVSKIEALEFAYLDAEGVWQDRWINRDDLPRAVEVRVIVAENDYRRWQPLVISLPMAR
jgi:general secretion pathway protein J